MCRLTDHTELLTMYEWLVRLEKDGLLMNRLIDLHIYKIYFADSLNLPPD